MSLKSRLRKSLGLAKAKRPRASDVMVSTLRMQRYFDQSMGGDPYLTLYDTAARVTDTPSNDFCKQNRLFTLHQCVSEALRRKIPGDFAECGCWRGQSTYIVAETLNAAGWTDTFWVFDSFEGGLSDKVAEDRAGRGLRTPEQERVQKEKFASSYETVSAIFAPYPFVSIVNGWIPQTFDAPGLADRRFALVHIDVDLYEPTRDSLAFFGPRMNPGGVIVLDDYGNSAFPGSKTAVDEFMRATPSAFFLETHLIGGVIVF